MSFKSGRRPTTNKAGAIANGVCSGHNAVTTGRDFEMCRGGESGRAVSYLKAQGRSIAFYDFFGNSSPLFRKKRPERKKDSRKDAKSSIHLVLFSFASLRLCVMNFRVLD